MAVIVKSGSQVMETTESATSCTPQFNPVSTVNAACMYGCMSVMCTYTYNIYRACVAPTMLCMRNFQYHWQVILDGLLISFMNRRFRSTGWCNNSVYS